MKPTRRPRTTAEASRATTVGGRAGEVVARQAAAMRAHLAEALDGRDPEGVHDMRVASRRLRAALGVLGPWLPPADLARVAPGLRAVTRALGEVREIDVTRLRIAALARRASPIRAMAIEALDARLARRLRRARSRMMARFGRVDLDRLDQRLRRLVEHLASDDPTPAAAAARAARARDARGDPAPPAGKIPPGEHPPGGRFVEADTADTAGDPASPEPGQDMGAEDIERQARHPDAPLADLLREAADRAGDAALRIASHAIPETAGSAEGNEALHEVRIAAKKLRYLLEIVAPELGEDGAALLKRLRRLQDQLGDFHDDTLLEAELAGAAGRAADRGRRLLVAELRRMRRSRRRVLLRDERLVRAALDELRASDFADAIARTFAAALDAAERRRAGDAGRAA
jgi:CHAD domain-containing protein